MFIDQVEIAVSSGKGGAGAVSFRREKFATQGGPDGGDGGRGGDVIFVVNKDLHTLSRYRGHHILKSKNGQPGMGRKMYGKKGENLVLEIPPGTQITNIDTGEIILDLLENKEEQTILEGGKGGMGNWHFRSSTNQKPTYAQPGLPGMELNLRLELKLIADVGLVGFPNVGKSTLISSVSNAKPIIANYEFTTLTPNLGVINIDDISSFVMADIPGIIEGASDGKGLGIEFLKHIERTTFLLFVLDITNYRTLQEQYEKLKIELVSFSSQMQNKPYAVAVTKIDANPEYENIVSEFKNEIDFKEPDEFIAPDIKEPLFVLPISSVTHEKLDELKYKL
ncbi:MAG: GTP-binding protein Obg, partial [uncultured Campylobacterales bacterium]